jgi:hypothetical protein
VCEREREYVYFGRTNFHAFKLLHLKRKKIKQTFDSRVEFRTTKTKEVLLTFFTLINLYFALKLQEKERKIKGSLFLQKTIISLYIFGFFYWKQ